MAEEINLSPINYGVKSNGAALNGMSLEVLVGEPQFIRL